MLMMHNTRLAVVFSGMLLLSGCSDIAQFGDSLWSEPQAKKPVVEAETPVAAPVQPVDVAANNPVSLGRMKAADDVVAGDVVAEGVVVVKPETPKTIDAKTEAESPVVVTRPTSSAGVPSTPLMVLRFNQSHLYYEDALTKAIRASEATKQGVLYDLVSVLPDISSLSSEQQMKIVSRSSNNMRNVAGLMQQLGVPAERIRISDQKSPVKSQEIHLFVQ